MPPTIVPSRYSRTPRYLILDDTREFQPLMGFRRTRQSSDFLRGSIKHRIRAGESFQDISTQYYGAPEYWFVLADVNPEIFYPGDLTEFEGTSINIPDPTFVRGV